MKRHKHADLIHAYAEGAEVQVVCPDGTWIGVAPFPEAHRYRIKPSKPLIDEETRKAIKKLFPDASWLAMDEDGEAVLYMEQPNYTKSSYYWDAMGGESWTVGGLDNYATDWRTSLVDLNQGVGSGRSTKGDSADLNEEVVS